MLLFKWDVTETLAQFSPLTLELWCFSRFNQILLSLFDISNVFHNNFLVNLETKMYQTV